MDAPGLFRAFVLVACTAAGLLAGLVLLFPGSGGVMHLLAIALALAALYTAAMATLMWAFSRRFKVGYRASLIDAVRLGPGDSVLDVGCGRGLLLTEAAKRVLGRTGEASAELPGELAGELPRGAVGVDRWDGRDQRGPRPPRCGRMPSGKGWARRCRW